MNVRRIVGTLVSVPALVLAMAGPGHAASTGVIAFAGTVKLGNAGPGAAKFCFFSVPLVSQCANGLPSSGTAAGAAMAATVAPPAVPSASPAAIDGLQGSAAYTQNCVGGVPVTGLATITANVHEIGADAWSGPIDAQWTRAGLVAVIQGDATGAALFAPAGAAPCAAQADFAVIGAAVVSY
jgi:hypothetical protein